MSTHAPHGEKLVKEKKDKIVRVIKHSDDDFTRALAIAILMEYGGEPSVDELIRELETSKEVLS